MQSARYPHDSKAHTRRRAAAAGLVRELLRRWESGEATNDADTLARWPQLMPELADELRNARTLRIAIAQAKRAGPADGPPLRILSAGEIDAPIELPSSASDSSEAVSLATSEAAPLPRVPGCALLREVSRGGQGTVYSAIQESTGRTVAVKLLAGGPFSASRHRARFEREAAILGSLRHPNIVDIIDRGRTLDGEFYLMMEYVEGCDLDEWWQRHAGAGAEGTRCLLEQFVKVCRAVDAAHASGIVHRDLKPSNVRVDGRGEPRVLDFGLARRDGLSPNPSARVVTISGQIVGSVPWASPEQAAGDSARVDARSDVYALGVMLYQALAGDFPYPVDGPLYEVLDHIGRSQVSPPSGRRGGRAIGPAGVLDAIVLRSLAKNPAARYASGGELAGDLECLLAGKPVSLVPRRRRRPRHLAAVAVILALCVLGGGLAAWDRLRAPPQPPVFALPAVENSIGMRLVLIPAGSFRVGSPPEEKGRERSEWLRSETVGAFYIGVTEVTQRQYERVVGTLPAAQQWRGPDLPVHNVSFADAVTFCRRLSQLEGRAYRLPSEVEWEYACRAGSAAPFYGGAGLDRVAWHRANSGGRLRPVGGKWPNEWGLYDMLGNAREWCDDPFAPAEAEAAVAGLLGRDSIERVIRGGDASAGSDRCRAAARQSLSPLARTEYLGFRLVLEAPSD